MTLLKRIARRCLPARATRTPESRYAMPSYSQEGEDRLVATVLGTATQGFYVDVGAHHPQRFSNTYAFYLRGWRGINIEARPGAMQEFARLRPRDINVEAAVSDGGQTLTYFEFNEPALNTFSPEDAERMVQFPAYEIVNRREIRTKTLAEILATHLPAGQVIDFLTVDVEGLDEQVLRSNDWDKYRPRVVLAEAQQCWSCIGVGDAGVAQFLGQHGYHAVAKTLNTLVFCLDDVRRRDALSSWVPRAATAADTYRTTEAKADSTNSLQR